MANLDGTDDVFDSRDVIERLEELESQRFSQLSEDEKGELTELSRFRSECENYVADWPYGETFVSDDYFEEYARELAEDIGAIDPDANWPLNRIDWEAAADDLRIDYTSFELFGTTYWARS